MSRIYAQKTNIRDLLMENMPYLITTIKDFALTIAAVSSVYVGLSGLHAWKRQLHGSNKYILEKNACIALYELREVINLIRSSNYHPEVKQPTIDELSKYDERQWKQLESNNYSQARRKCLKKIKVAEKKLKSCLIEIEAVLGVKFSTKIEPISSLINEFSFANSEVWLYTVKQLNGQFSFDEKENHRIKEFNKILYKNPDDKDEYMEKFEKAISDIRNVLKP
jgi:hypothetical protein